MNDQASASGSTADPDDDNDIEGAGPARLNDSPTEAEREGVVDQQGALKAEIERDDQG